MQTDEVISSYTDAEAIADGVLVQWSGPARVNRITRAVFDTFTDPMGESPLTGPLTNVGRLVRIIDTLVKKTADEDGWRKGSGEGRELWLVPNEVGGLTLMFPEDY
jgi:hypothetical protein